MAPEQRPGAADGPGSLGATDGLWHESPVDRAAQIVRVVHELNADLDLDRQLATLYRHLLDLTGLPACAIALIDEQDDAIHLHAALAPQEPLTTQYSPWQRAATPTTLIEALCAVGQAILTEDFSSECRQRNLRQHWPVAEQPVLGWLGVPLRRGEQIIGALAVWQPDGPLTSETVDTLHALAEQCAVTFDHARRYTTAERQRREEAALSAIAQSLAASLDGETIIQQIGRHAPALIGGRCQIALHDPQSDRLVLRGFAGEATELKTIALHPDEGMAGYVWRTGESTIANDYLDDPRFAPPSAVARAWSSAIGVPITLGAERLGALLIGSWEKRIFTGRDELLLARLATLIALAVRNVRILAAERERAERAEALREIGRDLSANLDLAHFFDSLRRHLKRLTGADNCWVCQVSDGEGAQLRLWVEEGERRPEAEGPLSLPLPPSMLREVVESSHSILTDDYAQECRRRGLPTAGFRPDQPHRAWLGLPLQARSRTIGALAVWRWDGPIPAEVVDTLEMLAGQIATALENARLYEAAERQRREEATFSAIAQELAAALDGTTPLQRIAEHARTLLGVHGSRLILQEAATGLLKVIAGSGDLDGTVVDPNTGLTGIVWRTRRPFISDNYPEDERFDHIPVFDQRSRQEGLRSVLAVPILLGDQPLGVLGVHSVERHAFSARDEATLVRLANLAAVAVHNAQLYAEARRLAIGDSLTGLLNHRSLQERLDQELTRAARHGHPLALVMLDLDNFKLVNDTYGHPTGDRILQDTATILRTETRASDIIARYGGDEFCLILPETTRTGALALIKRVQERCCSIDLGAAPFRTAANQSAQLIRLRVSAGVAVYPHDTADRHDLLSRADIALYTDKRDGRAP